MKKLLVVAEFDVDCEQWHCGLCRNVSYDALANVWGCVLFEKLLTHHKARDEVLLERCDNCLSAEYAFDHDNS